MNRNETRRKQFKLVSAVMAVVYLVAGVIILTLPAENQFMPGYGRYLLGGLLLAYSVFRGVRIFYLKRNY